MLVLLPKSASNQAAVDHPIRPLLRVTGGNPLLTTPFVSARPRRVRNPLAADGMTLTLAEYQDLDDADHRKILATEYRGA